MIKQMGLVSAISLFQASLHYPSAMPFAGRFGLRRRIDVLRDFSRIDSEYP